MPTRYRIRFRGPVAPGIVQWFQLLIPVLRQAPEGIQIDIEINHVVQEESE